jgi:hypothetical protein
MLIGFTGLIGSGKDTSANIIADALKSRGYVTHKDSFASSLKDATSSIFGWSRELLEGDTPESRFWREQADPFWSNAFGKPVTPRWALQYVGTDIIRTHLHPEIWVDSLVSRSRSRSGITIISDVRFQNEISAIKKNGYCFLIQRGALPDWFELATKANSGDQDAKLELKKLNIHPSETSWAGSSFDAVINNDGTIDDLRNSIHKICEFFIYR